GAEPPPDGRHRASSPSTRRSALRRLACRRLAASSSPGRPLRHFQGLIVRSSSGASHGAHGATTRPTPRARPPRPTRSSATSPPAAPLTKGFPANGDEDRERISKPARGTSRPHGMRPARRDDAPRIAPYPLITPTGLSL